MATRTSTQSGNFNSTATWGGAAVPVDGDDFIVNYGHLVTIDDDRRVATGYNDSYVRGKLYITGTGKLRMNGILYVDNTSDFAAYFVEGNASTAGFFRMDAGAVLEIRGTNTDQHRLEVRAQRYLTCEIEGTNPNPSTTISANADTNATSLSFTSAAGFVAGDWINVYHEDYSTDYRYNKTDEAFWIHDINSNTVYFRQFVSPTAVIQSVSGSVLTLNDASVFRKNAQIIFGTGANRNVGSISDINYGNNTITFSTSITGSVVGETIYYTGTEKCHRSGSSVLRVAATLTANSNSGSNTITVNNANGFNIGDLILIPNNDLDGGTGWDYVQDYYITGKNGNVLTIGAGLTNAGTTTLAYNVKIGGIIANMSRDTKITAPTYSSSEQSCIYIVYWTLSNAYTRRVKVTNTFVNLGSNTNSSVYGGFAISGYLSYERGSNGQYVSYVDGVVIIPTNRTSNSGTGFAQGRLQLNFRNSISYNAESAFYYWGNNAGFFSNIACRSSAYGCRNVGFYEPYAEMSYNYIIRNGSAGFSIENQSEVSAPYRHNYVLGSNARILLSYYQPNGTVWDRCYFDGFRTWPFASTRGGNLLFTNTYFGNKWDITGNSIVFNDGVNLDVEGYSGLGRGNGFGGLCHSLMHNFKINNSYIWSGGQALKTYNSNEQAWFVRPDRDATGRCGFFTTIFVPADCQVFISGQVKVASGVTNYPALRAEELFDFANGVYRTLGGVALSPSSASGTQIAGFTTSAAFTSASASNFETKTITLPAQSYDHFVSIGIILTNATSGNGKNGWYEKDLIIGIEKPYQILDPNIFNSRNTRVPIIVKQTANTQKIRLGGGY